MARTIKIECCKECPHHSTQPDYTSDSFDHCSKWICDKLEMPVRRYVGVFDKEKYIPETCPLAKS